MNKRVFDLSEIGATDRYKLMAGLVVPRPIGWIGSRSAAGIDNLAPFSFYNMVTNHPATVLFITSMSARTKDTLRNVRQSGCFTVNVVTHEVFEAMNLTSGDYGPEVDEFALAGLTAVEGEVVPAPMVAEARANLECLLTDIHPVGDGPVASIVLGEVVRIHVDPAVLDGTRIDFAELGAIGRMAGDWYSGTGELFALRRPRVD